MITAIIILLSFNTLLILIGLRAVWEAIDKVKRDTEVLVESIIQRGLNLEK